MAESLKHVKKDINADLLSPGGRKLASSSVVSDESMDSRFDQNESELGVFILSISFKMLSDGNSLLDQVVKIFRDLRSATYAWSTFYSLVSYHSSSRFSRSFVRSRI